MFWKYFLFRNEGFPEQDICFLGTLDQDSATTCSELLGRRRGRHLETQIDIQARKPFLEVLLRFWGRGDRIRRTETGFYAEFRCASHVLSGLAWGAIFGKNIECKEMHTF